MKRSEVEQHCLELVTPIVDENNLKLWDVCYEKEGSDYYLRVYVDKEDGVTIDDCVTVSRALELKLDEADKIKDAYILEVSSPGLTRPLKRENDFKNSIGRLVDIKFYKPQEIGSEKTKEYTGVLEAYSDTDITVSDDEAHEIKLSRGDISSIRLSYTE
jgi:ribosome maturation factor RimP